MSSKCICKGCLGIAKWKPDVIVVIENDNTFRLDFEMPLCDVHKESFGIDDVIPDETMKLIKALFVSKFLPAPKKENMKIKWCQLTDIEIFTSLGRLIGTTRVDRHE